MDLSATDVVAAVSVLLLGLSAGLFFAYLNSVMPALSDVSDPVFVRTMNAINVVILNPGFLLVYLGSLVATVAATVLAFVGGEGVRGWFMLAASIVYFIGMVVVTGVVNVPLNNALAKDSDRVAFEQRWVRWNAVRTVAAIIALALAILGALL